MKISLNGADWLFKDYYGEDWRWRDAHKPNTRDTRFWRKGTVPGSVHHDLWMLGDIPNPYFERNSLLLEWIPTRTWLYKKTFFVVEQLRGKRIRLCFEGVDYEAEFFLNGNSLGTHRGMYTPAVFEVSDQLLYDAENLLAVVIQPAPFEQPQVSRTDLVTTHKSRMTYWWDFCPRMIHIGIWDGVYLGATERINIDNMWIRPQLNEDFSRANLAISATLDSPEAQTVDIQTTIWFGEDIVVNQLMTHALKPGKNTLDTALTVDQPRLWYPNGHGKQPLYEAEINIFLEDGSPLDRRVVRFGIRKVELVANETSDPTARPYTLVVNGKKIFIKGWNWVPIDVMYGVERPEKLAHLFELARRANVNMLRVWGGGLIEKEAFYDLADQLGIMIWQEFIQSSSGIDNNPPQSSEFIEMMVNEAEQIIPRKRHHPSLVVWCGGNELTSAPEKPLDDDHPLLAALKDVVARLAPDRFWLPTSPTGRVFSNSLENIERDPLALHDVHGPWEYQGVTEQYELYNRGTSLLHSEFGVEGITNLKALNATIAPEHQQPVSLDNLYWFHLGAWWVKQPMWETVFGKIDEVEALVKATQFMQADGLRYAVEANRRRKYQNSGTLPWQFNEPYPMAACTSAVDYYGQPKPVYYAVAHAYEPIHISAKFPTAAWANRSQFEAEIWVNNSSESAFDTILQVKIIGLGGKVYQKWESDIAFQGNSATQLLAINWAFEMFSESAFFLDLTLLDSSGQTLSQNRYIFTRAADFASLLTAPQTMISLQKQINGNNWTLDITNTGNSAALHLWLEDCREIGSVGYAYFDVNHFCLLPLETKKNHG